MADTYTTVPVVVSRQRMDALHDARKAAGLRPISDEQMLLIVVEAGAASEIESLKLLAPEAA